MSVHVFALRRHNVSMGTMFHIYDIVVVAAEIYGEP